jgi:methionine synthase II (cobalamin-independent)
MKKQSELQFNFVPTCIGSMPHTDPAEICRKILNAFVEIPFWPQLPKRSFLENMYVQYSTGVPNVVVDEEKKVVYVDASQDMSGAIEKTYEHVLSDDVDYFAIPNDYARGFYEFLHQLTTNRPCALRYLKGQVTGPVSFGLAVVDDKKQAIFYHQELQEVLTKVLCMKARWQIRKLKEHCDKVIIFIDEPYMVSIGSSYVPIKQEEAIKRIDEVIEAIHAEGALAGIHCCGNTDWGLLLKTAIDIISFDAYGFTESLMLYPKELQAFVGAGRCIAWGIVPTSGDAHEPVEALVNKAKKSFTMITSKGIGEEDFLNASLITPSCGCGTRTPVQSEEIMKRTVALAEELRKQS